MWTVHYEEIFRILISVAMLKDVSPQSHLFVVHYNWQLHPQLEDEVDNQETSYESNPNEGSVEFGWYRLCRYHLMEAAIS